MNRWPLPCRRGVQGVCLGLLAVLGAACSTASPAKRPHEPPTLAEQIRARGVDPAGVVVPFTVTPELAAWARDHAGSTADPDKRLDELLVALLGSAEISLTYQSDATGTAMEVFETGRANCLGFAFLFAGLARSVGLPVGFLLVPEVERFAREGDFIIVSEHATVVFGSGPDRRILDFRLGPSLDYHRANRISDLTAIALYYSNLGAQALRAGDVAEAREHLELAAKLDPKLAQAWTNLGVARRRTGDSAGAEEAYFNALEAEPKSPTAYQNLAALAQTREGQKQALALLSRIDELDSQNPYSFLSLGDLAATLGNEVEAGRFFREAFRRAPKDPEVLAALGLWSLRNGQVRAAERLLKRARRIDAELPRVLALEQRLGKAKAS